MFLISIHNKVINYSINIVKFTNNINEEFNFKVGDIIKTYGDYKRDNYSKEIISFQLIESFSEASVIGTKDQNVNIVDDRTRHEFHLHTNMSTMDGLGNPLEFYNAALNKNVTTITITDHNSAQSFPTAFLDSKKFPNLKINYGVEFDVIDDVNTVIVRNERDQSIIKPDLDIIFFDIEATGLSSFNDELLEFGAIKTSPESDGLFIKEQFFVKPSNPIPQHIQEITNITDDDVKDGLNLLDALKKIKDFFGDSIIVAHNADYDIGFLNNKMIQNNMEPIKNPIIDTLKVS